MGDVEHREEQSAVPAEGKSEASSKIRYFRDCMSKLVGRQPNHRNAPPPKSILKLPNAAVGDAISVAESIAPAGYKGPVHNRETGETIWAGSPHPSAAAAFSVEHIHPEGHRLAQQQWTFSMSGGISHQVPHHKWIEMDSEQQRAFNDAGRLPFRLPPHRKASKATPAPLPIAIEASPAPPVIAVGSNGMPCSACGNNKTAAVKKFPTRGGLMRPLCGDCVYDNVGGDQAAYVEEWAKGRPV